MPKKRKYAPKNKLMPQPLPCPFCDCEIVINHIDKILSTEITCIMCVQCGATGPASDIFYKTERVNKRKSIERWNERGRIVNGS